MAAVNSLARNLNEFAAALRLLSQQADSGLLGIGERLGAAVGILGRLTHRFEVLPQELEDEKLRGATAHLQNISREATTLVQALADERTALSRLAEVSQHMGTRITQLRKTVRTISTLTVNARIEAAHIDVKGDDFSVFAKEVVRLARSAEATTEGYMREHEALMGLLRAAREMQADFARAHGATFRSVGQQLEASLEVVEARRKRAGDAATEIGQRSKRISEEIGAVVMALQIGDITRQRLEHVSEALDIVSTGLEPDEADVNDARAWSSSLTDNEKAAVAATVCRMQSAQVVQAGAEFEREIRRVIASLIRLANETSSIIGFGKEMYGAGGRHRVSFLEELQANLRATGALVRDCEAARDEVDTVVASVTASLGNLLSRLGSVRRIEVDMWLMGLNAALKCGGLGVKGRALSVVALELRGYAKKTAEDADALMAALQEVIAAAERFERDRQNQGANRIAVIECELKISLVPFEECGVRLSQALAALAEQGGEVSKALGETAAGITMHDAIGKALQAARHRLDGMAGSIATEEVDAQMITERIQFFANGRYTMASERDIHAQFLPGLAASAAVPVVHSLSSQAEASLEDVLF